MDILTGTIRIRLEDGQTIPSRSEIDYSLADINQFDNYISVFVNIESRREGGNMSSDGKLKMDYLDNKTFVKSPMKYLVTLPKNKALGLVENSNLVAITMKPELFESISTSNEFTDMLEEAVAFLLGAHLGKDLEIDSMEVIDFLNDFSSDSMESAVRLASMFDD